MATKSQPYPAVLLGMAFIGGGIAAKMCCGARRGKLLENSEFGMRLQYPLEWEGLPQPQPEGGPWSFMFIPLESENAEVMLVAEKLSKPVPLEVYTESAKSLTKASVEEMSDSVVEQPSNTGIRVAGHETAEYLLKLSTDSGDYLCWQGLCIHGDYSVGITITAEDDDAAWKELFKNVKFMFSTLRFDTPQ